MGLGTWTDEVKERKAGAEREEERGRAGRTVSWWMQVWCRVAGASCAALRDHVDVVA